MPIQVGLIYKLPVIGSVARRVVARFADQMSLKDWGAKGDGITDDTAAIQAAEDACRGLHWPDGTYKVTATIWKRNGVAWRGAGKMQVTIDGSSVAGPLVAAQLNRYGAGAVLQGIRDCEISGIAFKASLSAGADKTLNHIIASDYGFHRNKISECRFVQCGGNAIHVNADNNYGAYYNSICNNQFGDPADFSTGSDTTLIKGAAIYAVGTANQNAVEDNVFWRVRGHAVHLVGTGTWTIQRWTVSKNGIEWCGYQNPGLNSCGVYITGNSQGMSIEKNYIEGCGKGSANGAGIKTNNSALDVCIKGNLFANNGYDIRFDSVLSFDIDDNLFTNAVDNTNVDVQAIAFGGYGRVGYNASFGYAVGSGKFMSVAATAGLAAKIYGDTQTAKMRGDNLPYWGKFTPTLWAVNATPVQITCSSATATYERIEDRVKVRFSMVVSALNGATTAQSLQVFGADGLTGKIPNTAVGLTARTDATIPAAIGPLVTPLGFTWCQINSGADTILLRKPVGGVSAPVHGGDISVGSVIQGEIEYPI